MKPPITGLCALALALLFNACTEKPRIVPDQPTTGEGFVLQTTPGAFGGVSTMHYLTGLESGSADVAYGQEVPVAYKYETTTGRNGAYYIMADGLSKFTKFVPSERNVLTEQTSLAISSFPSQTGIGGSCFYDNDNLLIWSYGFSGVPNIPVSYALINVSGDMNIRKQGRLAIPFKDPRMQQTVDFGVKRGEQLFLGYHEFPVGGAVDSAYNVKVAVFDANTLTYQKTIADDRAELSGYGFIPMATVTENGDVYIIPEARVAGGTPARPSGVLRIKAGETDFDTSYFYNLSDQLGGYDARGLYYIGNGKLLTKVWNRSIDADINGYFGGKVWEEYLVDLTTRTATKLDVPLSQGYSTDFVKTKSNKWAFVVNADTGNFIYTYDPATGTVAKGLEYIGVSTIDGITKAL